MAFRKNLSQMKMVLHQMVIITIWRSLGFPEIICSKLNQIPGGVIEIITN